MKTLEYEVRAMLRARDRYDEMCNELGPRRNRYWEHDDDFAYWDLYEKRRKRVEDLLGGSVGDAYSSIAEFEKIVGYKVNDTFRMGWTMARTKSRYVVALPA